ncbi:MAG: zinc-dependent alcohol dehydrogenase family protein [Alphaproteobacteria bacterium]
MRAMALKRVGEPLRQVERPIPVPGPRQVLVKVRACGVCRTDLHVVDGDLPDPKPGIVPGHEIVGEVAALGGAVRAGLGGFGIGERVGIPWLGHACGCCAYCSDGRENLCDAPGFTGYQIDGGYADYAVADADFCFPLNGERDDVAIAPLLCAGLIGYRAWRLAGEAQRLGLYGFGAAAHILAQVAHQRGRKVYAFTRPGDTGGQAFARSLGAAWAGGSDETPPQPLDAAIIFAPVGALVPAALAAVRKGGIVVCAGIHMSEIPAFPYALLWQERSIRSVANLTRDDARAFLKLASEIPIRTETRTYPLDQANRALDDLRAGRFNGAAVLVP